MPKSHNKKKTISSKRKSVKGIGRNLRKARIAR